MECNHGNKFEQDRIFANGTKHIEVKCADCGKHIKFKKYSCDKTLWFGKYNGKKMSYVFEHDKPYFEWMHKIQMEPISGMII